MTLEQELLDLSKSPLEIIQGSRILDQTEARHFLHYFMFSGDDPLRPIGRMSYGERSRLELALLVDKGVLSFYSTSRSITSTSPPGLVLSRHLPNIQARFLQLSMTAISSGDLPRKYGWWRQENSEL
jgi:hypothetical protein